MIPEEPIQLVSSASSNDHLEPAFQPPLPQSMPNTELPSHTHDPDLSATVEEVGSTTMLDRTLVEGDDADASTKKHRKKPSASSSGHAPKRSGDSHSTGHDESVEGGSPTPWHPLHAVELLSKGSETQGQNHSMVLVEDDAVDSKGKILYPPSDMKTPLSRTSHLHLDLKPSSPQPWERIDPPLEDTIKSSYSPSAIQQRFNTIQKARHVLVLCLQMVGVLIDFVVELNH